MSKLQLHSKVVENNLFALRFLTKYIPMYVVISIVIYIAKGTLQSLSNVWLVQTVIDHALAKKSFCSFIMPVIEFSLYALLVSTLDAFYIETLEKKYRQIFSDRMRMLLNTKAIESDISCYDDTEYYNNYVWVANEFDNRTFNVFKSLVAFIQRLTTIGSTFLLLSKINLFIIIISITSCILNYIFTVKQNRLQFKLNECINNLSRKKGYVSRTFISAEYAKELRTSKISYTLHKMYIDTNNSIKSKNDEFLKTIWKDDLSKKVLGEDIILTFVSIIILSWQVINKEISIGTYIASYKGVQVIYASISFMLTKASSFVEASLYIEKVKKFLFHQPSVTDCVQAKEPENTKSLSLHNVSFSYENKERSVLNNISLDLSKPQKLAIVGSNGAGKTTLVKLILRLYDVQRGKVEHNGIDVKELKLESYRRKFACLFQDYNIYACSLEDNILMDSSTECDREKLMSAIRKSGFQQKYDTLPNGINTTITREFDKNGVILSGGEMQKVAIARVLYQDADCCILDEPTAALDPKAEAEFNQTILNYSTNKLLFIISHRLTTTQFMDKIIVLDNGEIVEVGTHDELIEKNGRYAQLYGIIASQYKR